MMKKISKLMLMAAMAIAVMFGVSSVDKAFAATGSTGACGASVWTDATTYNTGATTVDYQITKPSTQCGTVYYKAQVYQIGDGSVFIGVGQSGSFAYNTGVRSFTTSSIKAAKPYSGNTFKIVVSMYSNADYTGYLGQATSANFYVY